MTRTILIVVTATAIALAIGIGLTKRLVSTATPAPGEPLTSGDGLTIQISDKPLAVPESAMHLTDLDGRAISLDDLRGEIVLFNFWATWCGPCRAEHPNIQKNYEAYKDKGFEVVGISLDEDKDALQEYLETEHVKWVTLHDGGDGELALKFGIIGIPTVMLLDKDGKLVTMNARGPELGKRLESLLGPAGEAKPKEEPKPQDKD